MSVASTLGALLSCVSFAAAQVDGHSSGKPEETGPPEVIHRVNPHGMGLLAPTPGSTTSTSPILYRGGPVVGTSPILMATA